MRTAAGGGRYQRTQRKKDKRRKDAGTGLERRGERRERDAVRRNADGENQGTVGMATYKRQG